jgi:hypothetical protein|tara:strand:+ start:29035 stop:29889 length:855 start_codon:yes stop_codon:yes gene_type:complete
MAKPSSRQELIDYSLRQLGAPVIEVNLADEQIEDLVDDALQLYNERHYDGVAQVFLKYKITEDDIDRGLARPPGSGQQSGITTTSATTNIVGTATTFNFHENSNFIQIPSSVIGVNKVFQYDDAQSVSGANMFSFKYQLFLNDVYYWGSTDILSYSMTMSYLETLNFLLNTHKQIRYNIRSDRLFLDVDYKNLRKGQYLVIDCWRLMDPNDYSKVWNDLFLKKYLTAIMKRQWGMNLIKFQGVKLPGGIEFNGRQIYDDAEKEIEKIMEQMPTTYELPPLDFIG